MKTRKRDNKKRRISQAIPFSGVGNVVLLIDTDERVTDTYLDFA